MIKEWHAKFVRERQREVLSDLLEKVISTGCGGVEVSSVLDVGCGDGELGKKLALKLGSGCKIRGVDVLPRGQPEITVDKFDGIRLPFPDNAFEVVVLCDVLHHVSTIRGQLELFKECVRVGSRGVAVKDHVEKWLPDRIVLGAMDWVGNSFHGVASPGNYLNPQMWDNLYAKSGVVSAQRIGAPLGIHSPAFSWLTEVTPWGSELQFVEFLKRD